MAINRLNDLFFKYLLGSEENKQLALNFINAAVGSQYNYFEDVIFVNKDEEPDSDVGKLARLDIKGKLNTGTVVDIEVQVVPYKHMGERVLFYWARMYGEQIVKSEKYEKLKPAIAISLVNFSMLNEDSWINNYGILNLKSHKPLTDNLLITFLELTKLNDKELDDMTDIEKWCAYFAGKFSDDKLKEVDVLAEAIKAEMRFTADEERRYAYEMREKGIRDYISFVDGAREEGLQQGVLQERKANVIRIRSLMAKLKLTAKEVMNMMDMNAEDQNEYLALLERESLEE